MNRVNGWTLDWAADRVGRRAILLLRRNGQAVESQRCDVFDGEQVRDLVATWCQRHRIPQEDLQAALTAAAAECFAAMRSGRPAERQSPAPDPAASLGLAWPDPWPDPVALADVLDEAMRYVQRYVWLSRQQAAAAVLWSAWTYTVERSDVAPILIINSPANPTGVCLTREELQAIADVARRHNLLVISDEIYESLSYDQAPASIAGMYDQVICLNGFSKNAAMTGWRVGFAAGPDEIIQAMNTLQQYTFVCAPSFAQKAAVLALKADMTPKIEAYRRKRDIVYEGLKDTFRTVRPGGAFYIFPEAPGGDGDAFVARAIENRILIIPGSVFSERKTHFRISFAAKDETLKRGVEALVNLAKTFE